MTAAMPFSSCPAMPWRPRSSASSPVRRRRAFCSPSSRILVGNAEAASVVERFRAENFEPEGYTLHSYAAVQVWAQAVEKAGSLELEGGHRVTAQQVFDTVLGPVDFDDKGDLTTQSWVWYVWRGGEYVPAE